MAGVGHELALCRLGVLKPVEHLIHRHRQTSDLISGVRDWHPVGELSRPNSVDPRTDQVDRVQSSANQNPHGSPNEQHQQGQTDNQIGKDSPDALTLSPDR